MQIGDVTAILTRFGPSKRGANEFFSQRLRVDGIFCLWLRPTSYFPNSTTDIDRLFGQMPE
jgi:hypothetical protein